VRRLLLAFGIVLLAGPARGGDSPPGKLVLDLWDVAYLKGGKAGYVHTAVRELERDGQKRFRTVVEMRLTVQRFESPVQLRIDTGMDETAAGKVVSVSLQQYLGRERKLNKTGTVADGQLHLLVDGKPAPRPLPWDDRVIGAYRQQRLFEEKKVKPGDRFTFLAFEAPLDRAVQNTVEVKAAEEVGLLDGTKRRLLRAEVRPEAIDGVQLPTLVYWLDEDRQPVRQQFDAPGLGLVTLYRTTREGATAPGPVVKLTDIGLSNFVRLNKRIADPYATAAMVYRVTVKGDHKPGTTFSRDDRQKIKNIEGQTFELHVRSSRGPRPDEKDAKAPGEEFLQSSYFITSADEKVQEHARRAVADETDGWKKALRIEKWVHDHMKSRNDEALAPADHVARTLAGDCTEYAMLTAAMCRAVGVPARTAVGLIYADVADGPVFAFHMWTEVCTAGRWIPIDATLGRGHVGATHLKITDHSWHDTRAMTPLLPVLRVLGKVSIEVVGDAGG
jgi:transglutaminase-like putative cysteine protease